MNCAAWLILFCNDRVGGEWVTVNIGLHLMTSATSLGQPRMEEDTVITTEQYCGVQKASETKQVPVHCHAGSRQSFLSMYST